jgi:hypothetical protein
MVLLRAVILCVIAYQWTDAFEVRTCDGWSATCMTDKNCSTNFNSFVEKCGEVNLASSTCPDGCLSAYEKLDSGARHYCPCYGLKVSSKTNQYTLSLDCDDFSEWFRAQCGSALNVKPHFILILLMTIVNYICTR